MKGVDSDEVIIMMTLINAGKIYEFGMYRIRKRRGTKCGKGSRLHIIDIITSQLKIPASDWSRSDHVVCGIF